MARRPRQRTDAACRRKHDALGAYQHREECGGGWRTKHRHQRTPHRSVHAAAHQQRRHADSGGGGTRGVRTVLHHEAHGVGHRAIAIQPDDDGAGRQPRSRRTCTSRIPHHVRRNAVANRIHMGEHQYSHRMHRTHRNLLAGKSIPQNARIFTKTASGGAAVSAAPINKMVLLTMMVHFLLWQAAKPSGDKCTP